MLTYLMLIFMMLEGENILLKLPPPTPIFSIDSRLSVHGVLAKMIAWWHLALLHTFMSSADIPVHIVITDKELFFKVFKGTVPPNIFFP